MSKATIQAESDSKLHEINLFTMKQRDAFRDFPNMFYVRPDVLRSLADAEDQPRDKLRNIDALKTSIAENGYRFDEAIEIHAPSGMEHETYTTPDGDDVTIITNIPGGHILRGHRRRFALVDEKQGLLVTDPVIFQAIFPDELIPVRCYERLSREALRQFVNDQGKQEERLSEVEQVKRAQHLLKLQLPIFEINAIIKARSNHFVNVARILNVLPAEVEQAFYMSDNDPPVPGAIGVNAVKKIYDEAKEDGGGKRAVAKFGERAKKAFADAKAGVKPADASIGDIRKLYAAIFSRHTWSQNLLGYLQTGNGTPAHVAAAHDAADAIAKLLGENAAVAIGKPAAAYADNVADTGNVANNADVIATPPVALATSDDATGTLPTASDHPTPLADTPDNVQDVEAVEANRGKPSGKPSGKPHKASGKPHKASGKPHKASGKR